MSRLVIKQSLIVLASLTLASAGSAEPPDHAPAHGHRAKQQGHAHHETHPSGGFEVVFDSERGISIAANFPGVYFDTDMFYRHHDGQWQVSDRADAGWKAVEAGSAPEAVRIAHRSHGGQAKRNNKKR